MTAAPAPVCPNAERCELFPRLQTGGFLRVWQERYCNSDFKRCARYQAARRGELPPVTLLPSGDHLAID